VSVVVAFNAHPDDEALLTGGTLALLASQGHRVVLVTATDGGGGLADPSYTGGGRLGDHRLRELQASAAVLGAARVVDLGYGDSGIGPGPPQPVGGRTPFVQVPVEEAAERLARVLREESADLLLGYDAAGGYGHRDHVHVHHVARRAAELAGTPRLLEATAPREPIVRALRLAAKVYRFPEDFRLEDWERAFTPRAQITHRIDIRPVWRAKRDALAAHSSQTGGGGGARNIGRTLRLPGPVFRLVMGKEYFVDPAAAPGPVRSQLLEGVR
jgi:LmbE family N-acetylglucosaminyl deacetylase